MDVITLDKGLNDPIYTKEGLVELIKNGDLPSKETKRLKDIYKRLFKEDYPEK